MPRAWFASVLACVLIVACGGGDDSVPVATMTHGVSQTAAPSVRPSEVGQPPYLQIYGADAGDHLGSIAVGDFNGDGVADLALGSAMADGPDETRTDAGEVYVFTGPFSEGTALSTKTDAEAVWYGSGTGDNFGRAIVSGDFNGDGIDDIAVGAPAWGGGAGAVYTIAGGNLPMTLDLAVSESDARLTGEDPGDTAGLMLAVGNFDGDGNADLLVGALLADGPENGREDAGAAYVVLGSEILAGSVRLPDIGNAIVGSEAGDRLGEAVAAADVTGDGIDEIVVAAPFADGEENDREAAGETYVIAADSGDIDLDEDGAITTIEGIDPGDQLGHAIAAGDVDGDGLDDLWLTAVSADGIDNAVDLSGEAVLFLTSDELLDRVFMVDEASALVTGSEQEARLGRAAAGGDVNGDGLSDLVVSEPGVYSRGGRLLLIAGANPESEPNTAMRGDASGDSLGHEGFAWPPLAIGDLDGDGMPEIIGAAQDAEGPGGPGSGSIQVVKFKG